MSTKVAPSQSRYLEVGYVCRAHGLNGEVGVRTYDPASGALFEVERVFLTTRSGEQRELSVEHCREGTKELLLSLTGVDGRGAAQSLVGSKVAVFREDLEPPGEGEFFLGDLQGLHVFTESGEPLGVVEEIWDLGAAPNLVIRKSGTQSPVDEHIVPFAEDFVLDVKLDERKVVVRLPEFID